MIVIKKLVYLLMFLLIISAFAACRQNEPQLTEQEYFQQQILEELADEDDGGPIVETAQGAAITGAGATPFAIYNENTGVIVRLGDNRADVEKTFIDARLILEFEELEMERVDYYDFAGIAIDYDKNDVVRAIRLDTRNKAADWKIYNGIKPGNPFEKAMENYPAEHIHRYAADTRAVAYDGNGNSIPFSEDASYIVRFSAKEDKVGTIAIMDNSGW